MDRGPTSRTADIRPSRGRVRSSVLSLAIAATLVLTLALTASALVASSPDPTWQANDRVTAIVQVGDVVYLGGRFTSLHDGDGDSVSRDHLAAIDLKTGEPTGWDPPVEGEILALAASPDGDRIFVGGAFDEIGGEDRRNLAAVDATTGQVVDPWSARPSASVLAIATSGTRVFVGGRFSTISGVSRPHLGAVLASNGQVVSAWEPGAVNGTVYAVATPGTRVVFGGDFSHVDGVSRRFLAAVRRTDGSLTPWRNPPPSQTRALAVEPGDPDHVYAGNRANEIVRYVARNGQEEWDRHGDGDVQAVAALDGVVYGGGHFDAFDGRAEPKLVAFTTNGAHLDWNAAANSATGVFAMAVGTHLSIGGDFTRVNGSAREGYAAFGD
ncbi:MAG: hypothetical protein WD556_00765 [Actinomycetota bacterium]